MNNRTSLNQSLENDSYSLNSSVNPSFTDSVISQSGGFISETERKLKKLET